MIVDIPSPTNFHQLTKSPAPPGSKRYNKEIKDAKKVEKLAEIKATLQGKSH